MTLWDIVIHPGTFSILVGTSWDTVRHQNQSFCLLHPQKLYCILRSNTASSVLKWHYETLKIILGHFLYLLGQVETLWEIKIKVFAFCILRNCTASSQFVLHPQKKYCIDSTKMTFWDILSYPWTFSLYLGQVETLWDIKINGWY